MVLSILFLKTLYSEEFFWLKTIKPNQSFHRKNRRLSIVLNCNNVGLWELLKEFKYNKKMIILGIFVLQTPFVIFSQSVNFKKAIRTLFLFLLSYLSTFFLFFLHTFFLVQPHFILQRFLFLFFLFFISVTILQTLQLAVLFIFLISNYIET